MARSARARGSSVNWFTFLVGVPLGVGVLYLIDHGPWQNERVQRYVHHEAEQAVVIFFCCCIATLVGKLLSAMREHYALGQSLLPSWDGTSIPLSDVIPLQQAMSLASDSVRDTFFGRRIENVLGFVANRGSTDDLDDHLRTLSDNDALALDGSYAINRFLIWAMPILGFLGTVLGITEAITGISPEQLERGAEGVSSGLTKAFDATALALSLTLVAMFLNSLLEKFEQGLLEQVDDFVDGELAHRFARTSTEHGNSAAMQELLEKQAALWAASIEKAEKRWNQTGPQQEKLVAALQQALENALTRFGQRMVETEKKLLERQQSVLEALAKLATTLKDTGRDHQLALARLTDAIGLAVEMISKSQASETELIRMQETLSQNLVLLANSTTFEQAVESLTAAIHLLTSRVNPAPTQPRLLPLDKNAA